MNLIFTGLLASFLAFIINRYLVSKLGNMAIIYIIPLVEEVLKTGVYLFFGGSLIAIHLIFGLIEGSFDYLDSRLAAFLAIVSHFLFGYLTLVVWQVTDDLIIAIAATTVIHSSWNYLVGRL